MIPSSTGAAPRFILTARHSPFEIIILIAAILTGALNLCGFQTSPSLEIVAQHIPFYVPVWGAGLLIGGTSALISAFLKIPMSLILERIGLSLLGTLFGTYAVAIVSATGSRGIGTALVVSCLALGSLARVLAISRDIRLIGVAAAP